jgi:hypothetical protein
MITRLSELARVDVLFVPIEPARVPKSEKKARVCRITVLNQADVHLRTRLPGTKGILNSWVWV